MSSIKTKLLITILPSLAVIWLLCSGALYFNTKSFLYESLDQELKLLANETPMIVGRHSERIRKHLRDREGLFEAGAKYYFQVWDREGKERRRSESLGENHLTYEGPFPEEKTFDFETLSDGTRLRVVRFLLIRPKPRLFEGRGRPRSERRPERRQPQINIAVARNTHEVEATLKKLRKAILVSTLLGLVVAGLVVAWSVRKGLRPLTTLSEELSHIGSSNLDERLDPSSNPQELRIVSDKVNDLLGRLESAFERERQFGSDLAHEIRTPTAEIRALAEVGLTWPEEFGKEELQNVLQSAKRMEHTTQAILDLTRLSSTSDIEFEETSLHPIIQELLPDHRDIEVNGPENMTILTNRPLLLIILQNLIGNATTYAPEGDRIAINFDQESFCIENTAPELKKADLSHLFERFWRKDQSRTSPDHAGLGLRLASVCAEKLGYTITPTLKANRLSIKLAGFNKNRDTTPQ